MSIIAAETVERGFWSWVSQIIQRYGIMFLQGAGVTLYLAVIGTLAGFAIGLIVGSIKTIPVAPHDGVFKKVILKIVNFLLSAYIEIFRGTPMIVQAMVIYYGLMEIGGIDLSPIAAGLFVISINTGAYMSEIVRGGIESIDPGQSEAAYSIGMTHWQKMFNIILPQAIRNILPAVGNEFVINIKDSSVLNVISVTELYFMTKTVKGAVYRTFEVFLVTCVIYFVLTFTITRILRKIESKLDGPSSYEISNVDTPEGGKQNG